MSSTRRSEAPILIVLERGQEVPGGSRGWTCFDIPAPPASAIRVRWTLRAG